MMVELEAFISLLPTHYIGTSRSCGVSALGHKRTFAVQNGMSALPPKADMCGAKGNACFVPIADVAIFETDHLRFLLAGCPQTKSPS